MSEEAQDPLIGQMVSGRYRVKKRLGEGGMGEVYLAVHEAIEKKVALKVLRPEYSAKADIVERFQQEAKAASRIKHPNVLDIFDFGQLDNGSFFLAMEFLEGNDLADELLKTGVIDAERGLRYAVQICRALAAAHAQGVVHRDMKPENVFLLRTADGEEIVKIVDFGIAQLRTNEEAAAAADSGQKRRKLTKTGMIFGTPEYMAPEQAAGRHADLRVDIYATAIILYEMFTGQVPHTGDTFMAVLAAHLNDPAPLMSTVKPNITISQELQAAIMRGLSKSPDHRYQSMAQFSDAILATPEAHGLGPMTRAGSIHEMPPGMLAGTDAGQASHTAAQFAPQPGLAPGTHAQFPSAPAVDRSSAPQTAISHDSHAAADAATAPPDRVQTQLDATTAPQPKKGSAGLAIGAIVAMVAVGAGAAFVLLRSPDAPAPTAGATSEALPERSAPSIAATGPTPPPTAPPPASGSPAGTKVTLNVTTKPAGAVLLKGDFEVCQETPCKIEAALDEKLELTAKKGTSRGTKKIIASKDLEVEIVLAAPRAAPDKPPQERMCEVMVGELKVLRPCK